MSPRVGRAALTAATGIAIFVGCASSDGTTAPAGMQLTEAQLLDPATCQACHSEQYAQWSGSMHAYASKDPVFLAMNKRGQRETSGALGSFCVQCHAPLAVKRQLTTDGSNLDAVPESMRGVTCYFCHSVASVAGSHNAPLSLATDGVLRGSIKDPFVDGRPHGAGYSTFLDRDTSDSAQMCGSCHDIQAPPGGNVERTFAEWQSSVFAQIRGATCSQCHMPQSTVEKPVANVPNAPLRRTHDHSFAAVDTALTDFPDKDRQRAAVDSFLATTLQTAICVEPFGATAKVSVLVDNVATGHAWPSGASQDRRAWMEVVAYAGGNTVYSSGALADGANVVADKAADLWLLRDCIFDGAGSEVSMFWQAASYESDALPVKVTFDPADPRFYETHKFRTFPGTGEAIPLPDRVTLRVRLEPIGADVLDDLVRSGDLDPATRAAMPTLAVGPMLEWTQATAKTTYLDRVTGSTVFCATGSNLNVQADKFPAPTHTRCGP